MSSKSKVLFVDDDRLMRKLFLRTISVSDVFIAETATDGMDALEKLEKFNADVVFTDIMMSNMDGLTLLEEIRVRYPDIFVVIVTSSDSIEDAVTAMKSGAYDYILKPFGFESIITVLETITGHKEISRERFTKKDLRKGYRFENIVGQAPSMLEIFQRIEDVAQTNATVLITGETGTGKDLTAAAIHYKSHRKGGPFIKVNCAALTESLSNSELFGHEKGAFTGAISQKKGYFEIADGGTIFLDEIGDVPLPTQVTLLHSIESKTFQRVGSTKTLQSNIRITCATNKPLPQMVEEKRFREDLFYRINVVSINIPPLRERKSDIPVLADYFFKKYCTEIQKNIIGISNAAMKILNAYEWPGNVRELSNAIENAVIFCKSRKIVPANLMTIQDTVESKPFTLKLSSWSLPDAEATIIRKVLQETEGNLNQASKKLHIARGTLYSKMKKYGIKKPD